MQLLTYYFEFPNALNIYKPILEGNFPSELRKYADRAIPKPTKCPYCGHLNTWINWKRIFLSWGKLIIASIITLLIGPGICSSLAFYKYGLTNSIASPIVPYILLPFFIEWCFYFFVSRWKHRVDDTLPSVKIFAEGIKFDRIIPFLIFVVGNFIISLILSIIGIIVGWFNKTTGQNVLWGVALIPSWITLLFTCLYGTIL